MTTTLKRTTLTRTLTAKILMLAVAAATAFAGSRAADAPVPSDAAQAFESFKALAGEWRGTNGKGEPVSISYEVLAGGSTVLERFVHSGHGATMLTLYHLDGEDLMLTHYCMAGNQPRMRAEELSGDAVRFGFVDVTNLASPEAGHMHEAAFEFAGADRFSTAWTWRENGRDVFTESIEAERVK